MKNRPFDDCVLYGHGGIARPGRTKVYGETEEEEEVTDAPPALATLDEPVYSRRSDVTLGGGGELENTFKAVSLPYKYGTVGARLVARLFRSGVA